MNLLFWISYGLLWLIIAIQGFVLIELLHQVGLRHQETQSRNDVLIKSGTLKAGEVLPALTGISALSMQPVAWEDVLPHSSGMAIFLNTHCQSCRELAKNLAVFVEGISSTMSMVIIIEGTQQEVMEFIDEMQLDYRLAIIDEERQVAKQIGINWEPAALLIANGRTGEAAIVNHVNQLQLLIQFHGKEIANVIS